MKIIIQDIVNKIQNTEVQTEPFDHLIIDNLLSSDFYKELAKDLEVEDFHQKYTRGGYGNKQRFGVDITDYDSWKCSGKKISTTIHTSNYESLSHNESSNIKLFFDFLMENQQALYSAICSKLQTQKSQDNYFFHISMTKDSVGYEIEKHTDCEENIFTILFYAPETYSNKEFGLHIYKDIDNELGAKLIDFIPNRMVVFAPCEPDKDRAPTWHEVKRLSDKLVGTRNSFQIFFYKNRP